MALKWGIFIIAVSLLLLGLVISCNSLPPLGPGEGHDPDVLFRPEQLNWEETSMPINLLGHWYANGSLIMSFREDTLFVLGNNSLIQAVDKSESYFRIIYRIDSDYYTFYLRDLDEKIVRVAYTDSVAANLQDATTLRVIQNWESLTSTNPWLRADKPEMLLGNWHLHDGVVEITIGEDTVTIDNQSWIFSAHQSNSTVNRIILSKDNVFKTIYYKELSPYTLEGLLVDGNEDLEDKYGEVHGEWQTFLQWWDFVTQANLKRGYILSYDYTYHNLLSITDNTVSPPDSFVLEEDLEARLRLEVKSGVITSTPFSGNISLESSFQILQDGGKYFHAKKSAPMEVVSDSSWNKGSSTVAKEVDIFPLNDTLWFSTAQGNVFFASRKFHQGAMVNLRPFIFPFQFPMESFPQGPDIIGEVHFLVVEKPQVSDDQVSGTHSKAAGSLMSGGGFGKVYCIFEKYVRPTVSSSETTMPDTLYTRITTISCGILASYSPTLIN
ncbi:hypothetical protein ACFL4X_00440 [Gemmatimonadota bacterium]